MNILLQPIKNDLFKKDGEIYFSLYLSILIFNILIFLMFASIFDIRLFEDAETDGFYMQMVGVVNGNYNWIHIVRYIIVYPFILLENYNIVFLQSFVILLYMLPIILSKFNGQRNILHSFIVFLPLFVSFRTALVIFSVAYLFIYIFSENKNILLLFFYGLISCLSSGVFLIWALLIPLLFKSSNPKYRKYIFPLSLILLMAILTGLFMKIDFFFSDVSSQSENIISQILNILSRSNIYIAITYHQYTKLLAYIVILIFSLAIYLNFKQNKYFVFYFLPLNISFLFEGLGTISYLVSILFFILYGGIIPKDLIRKAPLRD